MKTISLTLVASLIVAACNQSPPRPEPQAPDAQRDTYCASRPNCGLCASEGLCVYCLSTKTCLSFTDLMQCPGKVAHIPEQCQ